MDVLINIDVDDLEAAVSFYSAAFGLEIGRRFGKAGVELWGGTSPIYLLQKEAGASATGDSTQKRSYARHWTPVHLDFVVDDVHRAVATAVSAGAILEAPIKTSPWGHLALLSDPFGHGFCLVEFLGRGYDEIASE